MFVYKEFQEYEKFVQGFFLSTCVVEVTTAENDGNKLPAYSLKSLNTLIHFKGTLREWDTVDNTET